MERARWLLAIQPFDETRLQGQPHEASTTNDGTTADTSISTLTPGRRRRQSHPAHGRGCASLDMSDTWSAALAASDAHGDASPASPAAANAAQALRDLLECRRALAAHSRRGASSDATAAAGTTTTTAAAPGASASEQVLAFLLQSDTRVEELAAVIRGRNVLARRRAEAFRLARTLLGVVAAPRAKTELLR